VQVDARGANVALTRPVRVPDLWAAASGVLGRAFTGHAARDGIAVRSAGPKGFGNGNRIEDLMLPATVLIVLVALSLILSMVPCPGTAARAR
jgi:hypothetical protein